MDLLSDKKLIPTSEASRTTGYAADYLSALARSGKIKATRIGRNWLLEERSLRLFLQKTEDRKKENARAIQEERRTTFAQTKKIRTSTVVPVSPPLTFPERSFGNRAGALMLTVLVLLGVLGLSRSNLVTKVLPLEGVRTLSIVRSLADDANAEAFRVRQHLGLIAEAANSVSAKVPTANSVELAPQISFVGPLITPRVFLPRIAVSVDPQLATSLIVRSSGRILPPLQTLKSFAVAIWQLPHDSIQAEVAGVYFLTRLGPESARTIVLSLGAIGSLVGNATARVPQETGKAYLALGGNMANLGPSLASGTLTSGQALGAGVAEAAQQTVLLGLHAASGAELAYSEVAALTHAIGDGGAHLALRASAAVAVLTDSLTQQVVSINESAQNFMRGLQTYAPKNIAAAGALHIPENLIGSVFQIFSSFFSTASTTRTPITTSAKTSTQPIVVATGAPEKIFNTYTTIVQGVSQAYVQQSLSALHATILREVSGLVSTSPSQTIINQTIQTAATLGRIQELSDLIVHNGDFEGGALNGGSVNDAGFVSTEALAVSGTGTTTFSAPNGGINLAGGCFAINDVCITSGGGGGGTNFWTQNGDGIYNNTGTVVGIGTTTPKFALTIASSTGPQLALTDGSATNNAWTFRSINGLFYLATSSPSTFATSSATALTVDVNGNVGIGTANPQALLAVSGTASTTKLVISGQAAAAGANCLQIDSTGNVSKTGSACGGGSDPFTHPATGQSATTSLMLFNGAASSTLFSSYGPSYFGGTATTTIDSSGNVTVANNARFSVGSSSPYALVSVFAGGDYASHAASTVFAIGSSTAGTATSTLFVVNSAGQVGIGTTSPTNALTISNGNISLNGGTTAAEEYLFSGRTGLGFPVAFIKPNTASTPVALDLGPTTGAADYSGIGVSWIDLCDGVVDAGKSTCTDSSNSSYETLRLGIKQNGSVFLGSSAGGSGSVHDLTLQQNGGNVFVAPSSSSAELIVGGSAGSGTGVLSLLSARNGSTDNEAVRVLTTGTGFTTNGAFVQNAGVLEAGSSLSGGLSLLARNSSGIIRFYTGGFAAANERLRIDQNGNVGIGTTTPKFALTIASSVSPQLALTDASLTKDQWTFRAINGNLYLATSSPSTFATSSTPVLTILDTSGLAGLMGLSSSSPWGRFSVEMGSVDPSFVVSNQGSTSPAFYIGGVNQNGAIGIGTSSPKSAALTIAATGPQLALTDTSLIKDQWAFRAINGNLYISTSSPSTFATSTTPAVTILDSSGVSGLVGLGSTTPWGRLSVEMGSVNPSFVVSNQGSSTPALYVGGVNVNGAVGIGTTTLGNKFATSSALIVGSNGGNINGNVAIFGNNNGICGINPTNSGLQCVSDRTLKQNINTLGTELDNLMLLRPVTFNWLAETPGSPTHTGFIAQEVQTVYPDLVTTDPTGKLLLNYAGFTPYIVRGMQDLYQAFTLHALSAGATSTVASWYKGSAHPAITVDELGNVGIGKDPEHALDVSGEVAGDAILVPNAELSFVIGSSTIAADLPPEVLTADHSRVDLFKLASYTYASLTALSARVDDFALRLDALEAQVAALEANAYATSTANWSDLFTQNLHASNQICVDDQCLTKDDIHALLQISRASTSTDVPSSTTSSLEIDTSPEMTLITATSTADSNTISPAQGTDTASSTPTTATSTDLGSTPPDQGSDTASSTAADVSPGAISTSTQNTDQSTASSTEITIQ